MENDPGVLPFKTGLSPFLLMRVFWVFRATDVIQLQTQLVLSPSMAGQTFRITGAMDLRRVAREG